MVLDELHYLADLLGRENPKIKRMLQTAYMHPEEVYAIKKHMKLELKRRGYELEDLPLFGLNLPEIVPGKGMFVGYVVLGNGTEREMRTALDSYSRHTLAGGMSGSGKSTLMKFLVPQFVANGVYPVIFDQEDEYSVLLKVMNPEDLLILDWNTDRDNLFEPPPGVDPRVWHGKLMSFLREVLYLREGTMNLLEVILANLYRNRGILEGSRNYFTILDVINFLDTMEFRPGSRFYMYRESLVNRFKGGLLNELGKVLICREGFGYEDRKKKCEIYRTRGLSDPMRNFYIYLKMMKELAYSQSLPPGGLRRIFLIDEAHKLYNREIARRYDLGEPQIFGNARSFSKWGLGCIYLDQVPSELPPALFANVNNLFVLRLVNGRCIHGVSQRMNLFAEQREQIPVLEPRHFVFQSGEFPDPVLVRMLEIRFPYVSEEEIRERTEKTLSCLNFTPAFESLEVSSGEGDAGGLPGEEKKVQSRPNKVWKEIAEILSEIGFITISNLSANLSYMAPWRVRRILGEMEKQGMTELCPVNLGRRGNPSTYVILKPKGAEFIGVKYDDMKPRGKGSVEHVILQNLLAEAMKDSGKAVMIEHSVNGKSVDIAEIGKDKSIAYEVELAPSHSHVVENLLSDFEAGFDEVVIINRNQPAQNEAKENVYRNLEWEKLSRVRFKLLREFL